MKMITLVFSTLVACGGGGTKQGTTTPGSAASDGDGVPCAQEIALECPEGQIDACLKAVADEEKEVVTDGDEESGGSGTAMALEEGNMSKLENAGTHHCVAK